jgi:predicted ATPase
MDERFVREVRLNRQAAGTKDYPFSLPALRELQTLPLPTPVTFLVGENGTGKSTLLEAVAICCGFNPEGGTRNFHFSSKDTHSILHEHLTVVRGARRERDGFFLRAESFYNVATEIERLDQIGRASLLSCYGGRSLHAQSHGESFLSLALNRFGADSLYLLAEPEAALSPQNQFALLARNHQLAEREDCQFLIATHSPILLALPGAPSTSSMRRV